MMISYNDDLWTKSVTQIIVDLPNSIFNSSNTIVKISTMVARLLP